MGGFDGWIACVRFSSSPSSCPFDRQVLLKTDGQWLLKDDACRVKPTLPSVLLFLMHIQQQEIGGFTLANGMYKWAKMRCAHSACPPPREQPSYSSVFIHSFIHVFISSSFIHSPFIHSLINYSLYDSFIYTFIHSFSCLFMYLLIDVFMYKLFTHSFIYLLTFFSFYLFICSLIRFSVYLSSCGKLPSHSCRSLQSPSPPFPLLAWFSRRTREWNPSSHPLLLPSPPTQQRAASQASTVRQLNPLISSSGPSPV